MWVWHRSCCVVASRCLLCVFISVITYCKIRVVAEQVTVTKALQYAAHTWIAAADSSINSTSLATSICPVHSHYVLHLIAIIHVACLLSVDFPVWSSIVDTLSRVYSSFVNWGFIYWSIISIFVYQIVRKKDRFLSNKLTLNHWLYANRSCLLLCIVLVVSSKNTKWHGSPSLDYFNSLLCTSVTE